ncbi:hypothetical protein OSSY52_09790 [Tepiditoga spiralis]|uniref:DUF340 domain-containing protein n=1 Tax=Tepiditoga spiralis TaxID=2108365 RepID=A0A7G1G356_9BACT|nr:LysO family transporter [Tepiditoga spiralis]BBE30838.1 hypothetical protein OSSY52_09790 [Tepiditoga spiralis]
MLYLILFSFIAGLTLGIKGKLRFLKKYKPVTYITVLLLFFMGMDIGANKSLISQLPKIGLLAFFIAIFSIIGSILFTMIYEKARSDKK